MWCRGVQTSQARRFEGFEVTDHKCSTLDEVGELDCKPKEDLVMMVLKGSYSTCGLGKESSSSSRGMGIMERSGIGVPYS